MKYAFKLAVVPAAILAATTSQVATAGEWMIVPSFSISESLTDNVDLDPDGQEQSAFVTQYSPGLVVQGSGRRLNLSLTSSSTLRHQSAGDDKGANIDNTLAGFGTLEVAPERLFLDASASISKQTLDTRQADSLSSRDTVQSYRASPYLRQRLGDFANAELRYSLDQVIVDSAQDPASANDASDTTTQALRLTLNGGETFARLNWSIGAGASEQSRTDDADISRRDFNLDLEFVVASYLSLLGGMGYQEFDDGNSSNDINGATWQAGFLWQPGPRTELRATYGEKDDQQSLDLSLGYSLDSRTRLTASYNEKLETSQDRLSQTLSFLGTDPNTGQLIDTRTGLPFDPNTDGLRIRDETTRIKALRLSVAGSRGRNSFSLSGSIENEKIEPTGDGDDSMAVAVSWNRQLNRQLSMSLGGNFQTINFGGENRQDDEYQINGGLNYNIFTNLTGGLSYSFRTKNSDILSNEFTENQLSITLQMLF